MTWVTHSKAWEIQLAVFLTETVDLLVESDDGISRLHQNLFLTPDKIHSKLSLVSAVVPETLFLLFLFGPQSMLFFYFFLVVRLKKIVIIVIFYIQ